MQQEGSGKTPPAVVPLHQQLVTPHSAGRFAPTRTPRGSVGSRIARLECRHQPQKESKDDSVYVISIDGSTATISAQGFHGLKSVAIGWHPQGVLGPFKGRIE